MDRRRRRRRIGRKGGIGNERHGPEHQTDFPALRRRRDVLTIGSCRKRSSRRTRPTNARPTSTRPRRARAPAPRATTSAAGSRSRAAWTSRRSKTWPGRNTPSAAWSRPTRSRRPWAGSAPRPARPAATATRSTTTSASTASSNTSATGPTRTTSRWEGRTPIPAARSPSSAVAPPAFRRPTSCASTAMT